MNSKKVWRALVANLLVVVLMTTANGGSFITTRSSAAQDEGEQEKITAEEEKEARELAELLIRRLQETNDVAPLVCELFVPDYAARLKQDAATNKSLVLLSQSAVEQASREELARYAVALNNSFYLAGLFALAYENSHTAEDVDQEWGAAYYKQLLPPDIIELCKSDPILRVLFEEETNESAEENQTGAPVEKPGVIDHDDEPIHSVELLRSFTSTLEQAIVLARKHLAASPLKLSSVAQHKGASEDESWRAERETFKPRAWTLNREFYGYPAGTRVICVNVLVYHMDLVRVDGKLKVLALYPDTD